MRLTGHVLLLAQVKSTLKGNVTGLMNGSTMVIPYQGEAPE
jgi:hypothetical protein